MKEFRTLTSQIDMVSLSGKTVLVTGATGLIGLNIVRTLVYIGKQLEKPINVIALVRSREKAKAVLGAEYNDVECIVGDIMQPFNISNKIDYIIHTASQTSSKLFIEQPVETIRVAVNGTANMLQFAKEKHVNKFIYLSTMEVYGTPSSDVKIDENHSTNLNTMIARTCYPESKRLCENLCVAYMKEYDVPINVLRLTQTFGPGVSYNDGRVFADFARCVIEEKDILLHTKGETKRNYLYTQDAVDAILTVLVKGENGQAYNVANEDTYCSIYEMAQFVANKFGNGKVHVRIEMEDESKYGFAPILKMNLDTAKIRNLGWKPKVGLEEMFRNLIMDMRKRML